MVGWLERSWRLTPHRKRITTAFATILTRWLFYGVRWGRKGIAKRRAPLAKSGRASPLVAPTDGRCTCERRDDSKPFHSDVIKADHQWAYPTRNLEVF